MAKGFAKGLVTGVAGTVAAVAGAVYAFKKKVIEPEEQKAAFIEEHRTKAARRRQGPQAHRHHTDETSST